MSTHATTTPTSSTATALEVHLTPSDLARRWGVSVGGLANARREGRNSIPYMKMGTAIRYRLSDVVAYETSAVVLSVV